MTRRSERCKFRQTKKVHAVDKKGRLNERGLSEVARLERGGQNKTRFVVEGMKCCGLNGQL